MERRILLVALLIFTLNTLSASLPFLRCFDRVTRRSIDNYPPLAEFQKISLSNCLEQCIKSVSGPNAGSLCKSVTYNIQQKACRIYDHDGKKVPAILHPALGIDFYKRTEETGDCGGPLGGIGVNPNFMNLQSRTYGKAHHREEEFANHDTEPSNDITSFRTHGAATHKRPVASGVKSSDLNQPIAPIETSTNGEEQASSAKSVKTEPGVNHNEGCATMTGYYVVIGNEIVMPISGEGSVKVYNDVEQGNCASYCSANKGPDGEAIDCNSLNYFPLTQKCELYSILAEPHGPGNLVENQNVIYAEKFCVPESHQACQEDEIFVLHVQKSLSDAPMQQAKAASITACLEKCLQVEGCKTSVFDSENQKCNLFKTLVSSNPSSFVDTPPGFVLIENGCSSGKLRRRSQGNRTISATPRQSEAPAATSDDKWSEWSACTFRVDGKLVKVRNNDDGELQVETC